MADVIVQGLRGSTSFGTDLKRRPENWREMILMLYPNGQAPLTALTALMGSEATTDSIFHWFEKEMPNQRAAVAGTGLSTTSLGGTTVTAGATIAAGATVYWQCVQADASHFKVGHVVHLTATGSGDVAKNQLSVLVTSVSVAATAGITGKLVGAVAAALVGTAYTVGVVGGTAYPEGDTSGTSIGYDPTDFFNYTQIFRNSLEHTRTGSKTKLRTGDAITQAKKECLELHSIEMERAFLMNPATLATTGSNGQTLRVTKGLFGFITSNKWDFRVDGSVANGLGTTWAGSSTDAQKTFNYIMVLLEQLFRYGSSEKLAFCGSGALLALQNLLTMLPSTQVSLTPQTMAYGFKVQELITPFGTLLLKTHPLMTMESAYRNNSIIVDTKYLRYRYVDDTKYKPEIQANDLDGVKSEYLTEAGLEVNFEKAHAILNGWGTVKGS